MTYRSPASSWRARRALRPATHRHWDRLLLRELISADDDVLDVGAARGANPCRGATHTGRLGAGCAAVVENGWEGFAIDGEAVPAREEVFA